MAEPGTGYGAVIPTDIYDPAVNALRFLAVDAINKAGYDVNLDDIAPFRQVGSPCELG